MLTLLGNIIHKPKTALSDKIIKYAKPLKKCIFKNSLEYFAQNSLNFVVFPQNRSTSIRIDFPG